MKKCSQQKTISWFPVFQKQIFPSSPFSLLFMRKLSGKGLEPWIRMILCQSGHEKRKGTSGAIWTIITITWWISMDGIEQKGRSREIEMHSFLCLLRSQAHWRQLSQQLGTFLAVFFFCLFWWLQEGKQYFKGEEQARQKGDTVSQSEFQIIETMDLKEMGFKEMLGSRKDTRLGWGKCLTSWKEISQFQQLARLPYWKRVKLRQWWVGPRLDWDCLDVHIFGSLFKF